MYRFIKYHQSTLTNFKDLKPKIKYKASYRYNQSEVIRFIGLFSHYIDEYQDECEYYENCNAIFIEFGKFIIVNNTFDYFKFVSREEYNSKLRDKFNKNALNAILKKIVNEDFEWL